jgi:uncharacterized oligopeptide transporter (OPT) family protein
VLGALITTVFTAANVYLGLKVGLTFASSIPAAVISMAVLSAFKDAKILENNLVQTVASAAGTLSAIIFVLPGLVIVGWWTGFPFWESFLICLSGGVLGVLFTIPLRRALVTHSDLPYPEGVAAAEVLRVGSGTRGETNDESGEARQGLVAVILGAAMFVGLLISWAYLVPHYTTLAGAIPAGTSLDDWIGDIFVHKVRFIGAGTIGVAAIWTLLRIIGPIIAGVSGAIAANRERKAGRGAALPLTERDIPIGTVTGVILLSMVPIGFLLHAFASTPPIADSPTATILVSIVYVLIAGVVIAAVCGYMAGLIGASNSPISGVGILSVLGIALILAALFPHAGGEMSKSLVAFALFVTAIVFGVATISNNNLQDLKTGQLVEATPWRQQVALVLGVVFGSVVIPPILDVLNTAFTFQGAPGAKATALAAPQAQLISAIAQGVLGGNLDWNLIAWGGVIGVVVVIVDELLRKAKRGALPPLAVGMGIYLPMSLTLLIPIGAVLGHLYEKWATRAQNPEFAQRMGVLLATGLIVGESLFGVVFAGIVAATGTDAPLALVKDFGLAIPLGIVVFAVAVLGLYAWTRRESANA